MFLAFIFLFIRHGSSLHVQIAMAGTAPVGVSVTQIVANLLWSLSVADRSPDGYKTDNFQ